MEMKLTSSSGELLGAASPGRKKCPPSRLQKQAPASLQLEQGAAQASPAAWGDGRTPIPLLSPLVMSPAPIWEADQGGGRRKGVHGGGGQAEGRSGGEGGSTAPLHGAHGGSNGERQANEKATMPAPAPAPAPLSEPNGGWRHPALPTPAPAPAPVSSGGWRHPALPMPVAEPASLVPLFKSQCAVEARNAQQ